MKKIKLIIILIMLCAFHIINGELFQRELKYYPSSASSFQFTLLPNKSDAAVLHDLYLFAEDNNVFIYAEFPNHSDHTTYELNIYCSSVEDVKRYFMERFDLREKTYQSIFSGKTTVIYHNLNDISDIYSCPSFHIIGQEEDINTFMKSVATNYRISDLKQGFDNFGDRRISIITLCIIGAVLLLLTLYELSLTRKEAVIAISLGEDANAIIMKNIAIDSICLLFAYVSTQALLSQCTQCHYNDTISIKLFCGIVCLNALLYLKIKFYSFRKAFARNTSDAELLTASYLVKFLSTTVTILILLPNCICIQKAISYNKQETFFSELRDYNYISFSINQNTQTSDLDQEMMYFSTTNQLYDRLYTEHFHDSKPIIIKDITPENSSVPILYCNRYNAAYLLQAIDELNEISLSDKVYICVPSGPEMPNFGKGDLLERIKHQCLVSLDALYDYECQIVAYHSNKDFVSISADSQTESETVKKPIIIFNNVDESSAMISSDPRASFWGTFRNVIMYNMNEEQFVSYMKEQGFDEHDYRFGIINVYRNYSEQRALVNRELLIVTVVSIMLIIMQIGIIILIIKLEYQVKSSEYCIKKLLGYNLLEVNRYIICHTIINYLLINIILCIFLKPVLLANLFAYIVIQFMSFMIEGIAISLYIKKMNAVNMNKILKGGKL